MRLISSVSFIIISIVLFIFVINPFYTDIKQLRTDVDTYNTALNNSTELQKTRDSLIDVYRGVKQEDKDRLANLLPSTIGNIELILEIEKLANLHGMPIKDIKFDTKKLDPNATNGNVVVAEKNPKDNLPYGIFPMEFVVDGRYDAFVPFLKDLEHNLRLVDVKSISFTVPNQTTTGSNLGNVVDPNIYSYTVDIETYWLK